MIVEAIINWKEWDQGTKEGGRLLFTVCPSVLFKFLTCSCKFLITEKRHWSYFPIPTTFTIKNIIKN